MAAAPPDGCLQGQGKLYLRQTYRLLVAVAFVVQHNKGRLSGR